MAKASTSIEVPVAADAVWNLIGGFDSLPDWLPYIPKSELSEGGRVRHLANPSGEAIVERLMAFDQIQRSYSYAILKAPFPVTNYLSTLRVTPVGGQSSRVEWSGEFTPNAGTTDQEASAIFQKIYEDGLAALANGLAKKG